MTSMRPPVPSHTSTLQKQCVEDSERWFGDSDASSSVPHMALSLAGEVGEVCNLIKKIERGSLDINVAKVRVDLAMELADVYTYLLNMAGMLNIDLELAYHQKRTFNNRRFTAQREARENAANG